MNKYRQDQRINASKLKYFAGDNFEPMMALDKIRNPSPPSDAMKLGTLVHLFVEHKLSLPMVTNQIKVSPYENFRKKEAQEWKKENPDYYTSAQLDQALDMARQIIKVTPEAKSDKAIMEQDFYKGEYKALLDCVIDGVGYDWKTTSATDAHQWIRDANNYHYALQAYHYQMVADLKEFEFCAVSSIKPYPVWRFKCTPEYLEYGKHLWDQAVERFNRYIDAEIEPSYEVISLDAPRWFNPDEKKDSFEWK